MDDLNGREAGNGGHSQGKPTAYRDSSTRREEMLRHHTTDRLETISKSTFGFHGKLVSVGDNWGS